MGLDGGPTEHHCHGIVDVRGRDVAVRVDILQRLDKSLFGIVDHCYFNIVSDTRTCKCGRKTTLTLRRSVVTPIRMTIPPASSLTRNCALARQTFSPARRSSARRRWCPARQSFAPPQ